MKFLCDRCKTRYSIGDERVRGKILKIRCKNCANVITVREGMPDADPAEASGPRRSKTTTQAPAELTSDPSANGGARNSALGAAFADAMSKPPPALEEEWYVSLDGDQSGPYSLAEAQRWVANQAIDSDLHCWSEGFDDWLPIDKVSHFRGLRKRPVPPPAPPPLPRLGSGPARAIVAPIEDEPKPLFAATMASLEKGAAAAAAASTSATSRGLGAINSGVTTRAAVTPAPTRTNGSATKSPVQPELRADQAIDKPIERITPTRNRTTPGVGAKIVPSGVKQWANESGESLTNLEAAPFDTEASTAAEPAAATARRLADMAVDKAPGKSIRLTPVPGGSTPVVQPPIVAAAKEPEPDDMDIGEVSRVVNLADLMRNAPPRRSAGAANLAAATNPALRNTGTVPKIVGGTVPVALIDAVDAIPGPAGEQPALDTHPVPVPTHHRGLIALLIGAALLVGAGIIIVVVVMKGDQGTTGLGDKTEFDTSRPDEIARRPGDPPISPRDPTANPFVPKKQPYVRPGSAAIREPLPTGNTLKAEEIESMANKSNGLTSRCFMRASKGVDGITLGDVKKITVTLRIATDGSVAEVGLSDNHANDNLGRCLAGFIKGWKFRTSPGGTFRFVLARPET